MPTTQPRARGSDPAQLPDGNQPGWKTMDPRHLQREYSPSSAIGGNYVPFVQDYRVESLRSRAACRHVQTLTYGDLPTNSIDLALPDHSGDSPLLVFIHGGYWQALSKADSFFGADWFADRSIAYGAIDYTLAPQASLTQIVAECRNALKNLFDHAQSLGIDPQRIFVAGSSAGAHLGAMCCIDSPVSDRIAGAILLSGIYDLEPFVSISDNEAVGMTVDEARLNSPLLLDTSGFPDTIITWGEQETQEFKRQSLAFGRQLQRQERLVQIFESPQRNHFDLVHDMYQPNSTLGQRILELVNKAK